MHLELATNVEMFSAEEKEGNNFSGIEGFSYTEAHGE